MSSDEGHANSIGPDQTVHSALQRPLQYDAQHGKRALMPYENGESPDQHCTSVQSDLGICLHITKVPTDSVSGQHRTRSACRLVQADLGRCCPQIAEDPFSCTES